MQVTITAVGPDSTGLADPIIHHLTGAGANIHEIQMYDHDAERLFAMLLRAEWPETADSLDALRERMAEIGRMNTDMVWAEIAVAALAGSAFYGVVALIERAVTFWHPSVRAART